MAQEDSRDKRPHADDLGQSFEAHSGNVGSAFEERNASPELLVHKKSHGLLWVILIVGVLVAVFLVYYFTSRRRLRALRVGAAGDRMGRRRSRWARPRRATSMCT